MEDYCTEDERMLLMGIANRRFDVRYFANLADQNPTNVNYQRYTELARRDLLKLNNELLKIKSVDEFDRS